MLFKVVHNTRISALAVVSVALLALWARLFIVNTVHVTTFDNPAMPLWNKMIIPLFGYSKYMAGLLCIILAFLTAFTLNRIVLRFSLLHQQSMLPFFVFTLLSSAFLSAQKLHPAWVFTLFFVLGIDQLFAGVSVRKPQVRCFNAGAAVGIGSLFYAKGLFLFVIFFLMMCILRIANHKSIFASLAGLALPFIVSLACFFYTDGIAQFFEDIKECLISNPGQYEHGVFSRIYMSIMILFNTISIVMSFNYMSSQKILTRRYFRCFTWMLFFMAAAFLSPFFSIETIPVLAVVSSVIITLWLEWMRNKRFAETVILALMALTVMGMAML
ncbi:MAG: hypothetical protein LBV41_13810 [Cytophagaceae bacterium]|jgi:hypothetical protein|nr:hypothetical protein [Cytophagaceae bacterium]